MSSNLVDLSIIIPCKNGINFIDIILNSIQNQTFQPKEIIFIDDMSTDGSYEYLCSKKTNIKIIKNKVSMGIGGSRNIGVENATGKYIYFMDVDDYFNDNLCIEKINNKIQLDKDVILIGIKIHCTNNDKIVTPQTTIDDAAFGPLGAWSLVFKRKLYVKHPENVFIEDSPWHFLQFDKFETMDYIEDTIYVWNRTNSEQITKTADFCNLHSLTLESYAIGNILIQQKLNDKWISDIFRNIANMYDIRNQLTKPAVKMAWQQRFLKQYTNIMIGHFVH